MTEVAKVEVGTDISLPDNVPAGAWGAENTSQRDTIIPRLHLMQDLSKAVKGRTANVGDIVHSATGQTVGGVGKPVEIIPIYCYNDWIISHGMPGGKKKFVNTIRMTPENEAWPYEEVVEGVLTYRQRRLNFFVIFPGQVGELPALVSFKGMSTQAGRKLMTHFQRCQSMNIPPASKIFQLSSNAQSKDEYNFFVYDVVVTYPTKPEDLANAYQWYLKLSKADVKVAADLDTASDADEGPAF